MPTNQPRTKRDEGGQPVSKNDGANKGTSSGGTPGGKLPNDKSSQSGTQKSTEGKK
jgi:hypothetical protein